MKLFLRFPTSNENSKDTGTMSMDWVNTKIAAKFENDRNTGTTSTVLMLTLYSFYI